MDGRIKLQLRMEELNRIDFSSNRYEVSPIIISPDRKRQLNDNLLMFFTGFTRFSSEVQKVNFEGDVTKRKTMLKENA